MGYFRRASVVVAAVTGLLLAGTAPALAAPSAAEKAKPLTAIQTADKFLTVAYLWEASWFPTTGPSIGKRAVSYVSAPLDTVLKKVVIGPETDADRTTTHAGTGTQRSAAALGHGVHRLVISLPLTDTGNGAAYHWSLTLSVHVKKLGGVWKVVGASLPTAQGPAKYCVNSPAATAHCTIYPAGS